MFLKTRGRFLGHLDDREKSSRLNKTPSLITYYQNIHMFPISTEAKHGD